MKLVTVDPEVTRVRKRKVVTVLRDLDGSLTVQVGAELLPMEEFLENHIPMQVGGFSVDGDRMVALMIAEETEQERAGSLGF
jgi:hypothetical protein